MTSPAFTFDRYAFIDRLRREAGIDERTALAHAEALDGALRDAVATKADIAGVRQELHDTKTELKADIAQVRQELHDTKVELKAEIADVRNDLKDIDRRIDVLEADMKVEFADVRRELRTEIAGVRTEVSALRTELSKALHQQTLWLGGIVVAGIGVLFTLLKVFQ